jgi:hypothetical protein
VLGRKVPSDLVERVRIALVRRLVPRLERLRTAGGLVVGRSRLLEPSSELVLTAGAPPPWLQRGGILSLPVDRDALGSVAGGRPRRAIGILAGRITGDLARDLDDLREIS